MEEQLKEQLKERGLSDGSIKLYIRNLQKLNDGEITDFKFLKSPEKIITKIEKLKNNTKRSVLISIVSVLGCCPDDKKLVKLRKQYYDLMIEKNNEIKESATDEATEDQKKNWISWDDVKKKFEELKEEVEKFKNEKILSDSNYTTLLGYMVLALYVHNPPRRNKDYQLMNIVKKYNDKYDNDINYLSYDENKFIFNNYKTSKKYGRQILDINDELKECVDFYLKFHPKVKGKITKTLNTPFLVSHTGSPLVQTNSMTKLLNKVFGKKISSSALRHIFLTDKYKDVVDEMKDDADKMGHSTGEQKNYIKEI
jgi:integrase